MSPTPFLSKIKLYSWLAISGLGIIGAAHQLAAIVDLFNFFDSVWCSGLAMASIFIAMAAIGILKTRHSLRWYVWMYIPVLAIIGIFATDGISFFTGPVCFGEFEFMQAGLI